MPRTLALALLCAAPGAARAGQTAIEQRPFAILNGPQQLMQNFDGWFDAALGVQKIGIFLTNTGPPLTGVQGVLSFPDGSGIVPVSDSYDFGAIDTGVAVLGIFEADFTGVAPAKYLFTLELTGGGGFEESVAREAFVAASSVSGPTTFSVTVPQGTIEGEFLGFYGGDDVRSAMAPTLIHWTMTPTAPFAGQFSDIPFQDPWWKAFGAGMVIGAGINMVIDGIAEKCGGDYMDSATEKINTGLAVTGGGAAAADVIDPFRRGEENTFPLPEELTTSEEVLMNISYDAPPVAQEPFTGTVEWTFTRHTTGNDYQYQVLEPFANQHFTLDRQAQVNQPEFLPGQLLVVTASASSDQGALAGPDAYAFALLSQKLNDHQKLYLTSLIMHDDGTSGDETPADGVYTATLPIESGLPEGEYVFDVLFQDVNQAPQGAPPLEAATYLGGFLVAHPGPLPLPVAWSEDFDSYELGSSMHGQGGWKGWDNNAGATAFVTDAQARSSPHAVDINGPSDLVHEFSGYTSGHWAFSAWQYVPDNFQGTTYFILLNEYNDGGPYNWSTQVKFDSAGFVESDFDGAQLPLITGRWVELRVEIDLDADSQTFFYDGAELYTKSWTDGVSGGGTLNIGAVDLFANAATSVFYDDLALAELPGGTCPLFGFGTFQVLHCPGDLDGDNDTDQADLGILLSDWGCSGGDCPGDLDHDGDTDQADLGILLSDWGCGL